MSKEKKSRASGVGKFFGGTFFGFILCLALLAGLGAFVYFKVSAQWINSTFKTEIDLGNDQINGLTPNKLVSHAMNLLKNKDTYTINDLKNDFGIEIGDQLMGIDISDLKNVGLSDLSGAIKDKVSNISAYELDNESNTVVDLSDMQDIFESEITYYFNNENQQLYKKSEFNDDNLVSKTNDFDYDVQEISSKTYIKIKKQSFEVKSGEVKIELQYLPLTYAISSYTSNLGENITLKDLHSKYGVNLPTYIYNPDTEKNADKTINQISGIIDDLYVYEILGYTLGADDQVMDDGKEVIGALAKIAKEQVKNLGDNIQGVIDGLTIAEALDYKYDEENGFYQDKNSNEQFDADEKVTGILTLIDLTSSVASLPDTLSTVISDTEIDKFITAGVVEKPDSYDTYKDKWIEVGEDYKQVKTLLLQDIVDVFFDNLGNFSLEDAKPTV
ncbi:MAG: hypothetical protein IKM43_00630 [Clostridia bacterium]|nr:hypothetical protein [Clostridia bacterium]